MRASVLALLCGTCMCCGPLMAFEKAEAVTHLAAFAASVRIEDDAATVKTGNPHLNWFVAQGQAGKDYLIDAVDDTDRRIAERTAALHALVVGWPEERGARLGKAIKARNADIADFGVRLLNVTDVQRERREKTRQELIALAALVKPDSKWTYREFNDFLVALPDAYRLALKKSLDLAKPDDDVSVLKGKIEDCNEIEGQLLSVSSHWLSRPFRNAEHIAYHELVQWVGKELKLDETIVQNQPTIAIERAIVEKVLTGGPSGLPNGGKEKLGTNWENVLLGTGAFVVPVLRLPVLIGAGKADAEKTAAAIVRLYQAKLAALDAAHRSLPSASGAGGK